MEGMTVSDFFAKVNDLPFTDKVYIERLADCEADTIFSDLAAESCEEPAIGAVVRVHDGQRLPLCLWHLARFVNGLLLGGDVE